MQRRDFLKKSSLTASATAFLPSILSASSLTSDKVRMGVIGTGQRGTGLIRLMKDVPNLEVVACSDIIPFRLAEAMTYTNRAKSYEDYRKLLEDKNVDGVVVATPYSMHGKMALDALDSGKHVFCEKTMVKGHKETQAVVNKVNDTSIIFQTGHQYRSSPLYQKVVQIIQSGYIGELTAIECQWNRNGNWRRPVPNAKWERMINWRMYRAYSGGLIAELMSHQMDFVHWITGALPRRFAGFGGIDHWKDGRETFDNIHLMVEYENGLDASYISTTTNAFEGYQIKILGEKATIRLGGEKGEIFIEKPKNKELGLVDGVSGATKEAWSEGKGAPIDGDGSNPTQKALVDFRDAITNNKQPISDVRTGALVSKSVDISLDAVINSEVKYWKDYPKLSFE